MALVKSQFVLSSPVEEQVFLNALLVDIIWSHLDTQDLIRASLVSKAWCAKSREILIKDNRKHPVCIQIYDDSPCKDLVKFQTFLEQNYGEDSRAIIFNGIQLNVRKNYKSNPENHYCGDCLDNDPLYKNRYGGVLDLRDKDAIRENTPNVIGALLQRIKFRYIRLQERIEWFGLCPFKGFMQFLLRKYRKNVLEIDLGACIKDDRAVRMFLYRRNWRQRGEGRLLQFPNLEVLGISERHDFVYNYETLQLFAPSLKRINRLPFRPFKQNWLQMERKAYKAVKSLGFRDFEQNKKKVQDAITFLEEVRPEIENLKFERISNDSDHKQETCSEELQNNLFQLGNLVCNTLETLACSLLYFTLLACNFHSENQGLLTNNFKALKSLDLVGEIGADVMDWFAVDDIWESFPKLKQVRLNFEHNKPKNQSVVQGPFNRVTGSGRFPRVAVLLMETSHINKVLIHFLPCWLNLFPNINHLDLTGMPLRYDRDDRDFARILTEMTNLPLLEELTIRSSDLGSLNLDHLFTENVADIEKYLDARFLEHLLVYKVSLLENKQIKKININGEDICSEYKNYDGKILCSSTQAVGTFLISSRTAQLIRQHRPEFTFCLVTDIACKFEGDSVFHPGGFRLEHLKQHAVISAHKIAGAAFKRRWNIGFLNLPDEEMS